MSDFKDFFSKNAEEYAKSASHKSGEDLNMLIRHLALGENQIALDLASGTGFTAMALAKYVSKVIAYDGTPEMLDQARKLAGEQGIANIDYTIGNVSVLPFKDFSFDIVTCRRAAHHFTDKKKFLSEAHRVLKHGGKLGLVDMARPESDNRDLFNQLEKIRDSSHVGAEKVSVWKDLLLKAGFELNEVITSSEEYTIQKWLSPVKIESEEGRKVLQLLEQTPEKLLLEANVNYKNHTILKPRVILIGIKP